MHCTEPRSEPASASHRHRHRHRHRHPHPALQQVKEKGSRSTTHAACVCLDRSHVTLRSGTRDGRSNYCQSSIRHACVSIAIETGGNGPAGTTHHRTSRFSGRRKPFTFVRLHSVLWHTTLSFPSPPLLILRRRDEIHQNPTAAFIMPYSWLAGLQRKGRDARLFTLEQCYNTASTYTTY